MAARVIRVVLKQFTILNDVIDFIGTDHALRTRHLTNRVGQKQQSFFRRLPNVFQNCHLVICPVLTGCTKRLRHPVRVERGQAKITFTISGILPSRTRTRSSESCRLCKPTIVCTPRQPTPGRSLNPVYRGRKESSPASATFQRPTTYESLRLCHQHFSRLRISPRITSHRSAVVGFVHPSAASI